jgi:hypothetical protein
VYTGRNSRASFARGASARLQRGQALVFIAVTTVILLLVTLATYNVGQLSYHRIKLQNTADAAAYSAAVAHARELNFSAYMNRGVIANQVSVAQIVSLTGWARNLDDNYNGPLSNIADSAANMSALGFMWTVPANIIGPIGSGMKSALDAAAPAATLAVDTLINLLNGASDAYHIAMSASIGYDLIREVIEANEPDAQVSMLGEASILYSAAQQLGFSKTYKPSNDQDGDYRMAYVTQASMDIFYKNRSLPPIWPLPFLFDPLRLFTYGPGPLLMMQFHSGGSTLKDAKGNASTHLKGYTSLDATGLFMIFCVTVPGPFFIPLPICVPLIPPLSAFGSGAAATGQSSWAQAAGLNPFTANVNHRNGSNTASDPAALLHFGAAHTLNPATIDPAWIQTGKGAGSTLNSGSGIRDYRDIKGNATAATSNAASTPANRNDVAPPWILEIERPLPSITTSNNMPNRVAGGTMRIGGSDDGQLALPPPSNTEYMRALSRSEAYFKRPTDISTGGMRRADNKTEWGSLYSPYWQARLQPNGIAEQAASILSKSLFGL